MVRRISSLYPNYPQNLSEAAFNQLIGRAGKHFHEGDAEFIRSVSGQYPFLVQAVAAKLWEREEDGLRDYARYDTPDANCITRPTPFRRHLARVDQRGAPGGDGCGLGADPGLVGNHAFSRGELLTSLSDFAPELEMLEDLGLLQQSEDHLVVTQGAFLWWLADELKRNVRNDTEFKSWLQAQEMDGAPTVQQKEELAHTTSTILGSWARALLL